MAAMEQVPCVKLFSRIHTPPKENLIASIEAVIGKGGVVDLDVEYCYHFELSDPLEKNQENAFPGFTEEESKKLVWLFGETFLSDLSTSSLLEQENADVQILELGPRLNFSTAFSTNAVCICQSCGLNRVQRVEKSRRLWIQTSSSSKFELLEKKVYQQLLSALHDPMTECVYESPLTSLTSTLTPEGWFEVPVLEEGEKALKDINVKCGFGWDEADLAYYYNLFANILKRNPTNVECFDLSQSNSEHSRHWFFKGKMVIDGEEQPHTLLELVINTLKANPDNSVLSFCDNSSTIRGKEVDVLYSPDPANPSIIQKATIDRDLLFTAETHNFPTGVAPFPGAETGVGGRIRDTHATGRGSLVVAGTAGYSVGNLHVPGYPLAWEGEDVCPRVHSKFANPLQVIIDASDGASDYGNKFGEPLINGFCRSVGMMVGGEQREFLKPIMFSGGIGQMNHAHAEKGVPKPGMKVVKLGGPCYRIGVGGGAASSTIQGKNEEELDFQAVQRGDAEMEQKVNRVIRACVELGEKNPIVSIHDQGAGGNGNVLKEIVEPAGGKFEVRNLLVGDKSLSVLEIWGAEYQENDALLLADSAGDLKLFDDICKREGALYSIVGEVTGDGYVTLHDKNDDSTPFNLHLDHVLGKMPQKTFTSERKALSVSPFQIPLSEGIDSVPNDLGWAGKVSEMLDRVLRLLGVGSKRFLTTKVDRSVTGLVAQQQCVGPLHLPLANCGVIALSHTDKAGGVTAIGEQPVKGLANPQAMGRLCVGEMLTNICWCYLSGGLTSIKCSGNWMWPAKLPNEDASLYDTCVSMCGLMEEIGVAIDGGKDSLSMASKATDSKGNSCFVKCPGTLVVSGYAVCDDVTQKVTPDLKGNGNSSVLLIDVGQGKSRMGGSSLSQVYGSVGGENVPDVDNGSFLKSAFNAVQALVKDNLIVAGHDRSDGGLITTLLEMCFSGNCGFEGSLSFGSSSSPVEMFGEVVQGLFNEELGMAVEVMDDCRAKVEEVLSSFSVPFVELGRSTSEDRVVMTATWGEGKEKVVILDDKMTNLRDVWEATGFELEKRQANPICVKQEQDGLATRTSPPYSLTYSPAPLPEGKPRHSIAVLREEGSNGDREMTAAFYLAGFNVRDVTMSDLVSKKVSLSEFRGIAFVGGFSFADVLGSAKGWGAQLKFSSAIEELKAFFARKDTFSLGICNGCQLMALLGLTPFSELEEEKKPRFVHNESGRFESRFTTLRVEKGNPSIFFKGMEGSVLGCWSSHGEGRAYFPDDAVLKEITEKNLAPIRYVDDSGEPTQAYPFNPNGSTDAIAGLCSVDGRHTAIMPHPERTCFPWSWPHTPQHLKKEFDAQAPWMKMFHNARQWCDE